MILLVHQTVAEYERCWMKSQQTEGTPWGWIFDQNYGRVLYAVEDEKEVGFALFFHKFLYLF
jgi:hypothetical protein